MSTPSSGFGRLKSLLWPVHRSELKKVIPTLLIAFFITFNYNVLRAAKDALIVTAPESGAEAIPFLKVWGIIPAIFIMTFLYTRVANRMSKEKIFYTMTAIFLSYFLLFSFVLYPYRDSLHPHQTADFFQTILPSGFKGFIAIFRYWVYSSFYVMSEMWSSIMMTILFWGFANDVTSVKDAKRHYALFAIGANASGIVAGQVSVAISNKSFISNLLPFKDDSWVILINLIVICTGILCMALFRWIHNQGYGYNSAEQIKTKKPKIKMGLRKNFAYISKSKYLIYIAIIVLMYNMTINLFEVIWKDQVRVLYPTSKEFIAYMGKVISRISYISTFTSIFITGNFIRRFKLGTAALVPPLIILVTGVPFFFFLLGSSSIVTPIAALFGATPIAIGVLFGTLQNCLGRASKYTFFDATKELALIPLSDESKMKGKAAIDGIGSRIGKSGGSIIHQGLILALGSVSMSIPYVGIILAGTIGTWIFAVRSLDKQFTQITSEEEPSTEEPKDSDQPPVEEKAEEKHLTTV